ncbi:hypothetical protein B0H13DRAFT_1885268 [Mycena leptocephala]|nr:hypothetical protein B0H13DRAFT_1885268 [Mycena leptocephala]
MSQDPPTGRFRFHRMVCITDRLSMLSIGTYLGAYSAVFGAIPYAIEGAIKARPGLRLPFAASIMRTAAPGMGAWVGSSYAILPLGTYAVEALGFEEDSVVDRVWSELTCARWVPKGHFLSSTLEIRTYTPPQFIFVRTRSRIFFPSSKVGKRPACLYLRQAGSRSGCASLSKANVGEDIPDLYSMKMMLFESNCASTARKIMFAIGDYAHISRFTDLLHIIGYNRLLYVTTRNVALVAQTPEEALVLVK